MQKNEEQKKDTEYCLYEIAFLILPTIGDEAAQKEFSNVSAILAKHAATVKASEGPTLRGLAYEMEKKSQGKNLYYNNAYFGSVTFEVTAEAISEIKTDVEKMDSLLRVMIIETTPEALMPQERRVMGKIEPEKFRPEKSTTPKTPLSEAELDKTIEQLVVE